MPGRPGDDDIVPIDAQLAWQEEYCRSAGSPTAALLLQAVRDDLAAAGVSLEVLPERTRFGDLLGLRIMAVLHRLAIERQAPAIAIRVPTLGGIAPDASANPARERIRFQQAVIETIAGHLGQVRQAIAEVPQTNEVGRSVPLRIALSRIAARHDSGHQEALGERPRMPVRLLEIGASAGLNLRADHLPGDPSLEAGPMPAIVERLGCDLHPIDATTTAGRARLTSYVWLDDVERYERLRQAFEVAARVPATVIRQDAVEFVRGLRLREGTITVLWHSAMWIYLPPKERQGVERQILRLASQASASMPLWHVWWEWSADAAPTQGTSRQGPSTQGPSTQGPSPQGSTVPETFALGARAWCGTDADGVPVTLATGMSHGRQVRLA
ncbi:MAG: DUF2332 family protein [Actinomycetales bacterium]|nr:DUF2332 family protein [Actinomycetales bacterium]